MRIKLYRGRWYAVWREKGTTRRKSLETVDRGTAERRLADMLRLSALERGGRTVERIVKEYMQDKSSIPSYHSLASALRAVLPHFGHLRPDQITRERCRTYIAKRRSDGVSDGTIIKELGSLRSAVRWSGQASGATFEMPPSPPPRERFLTREERDRLLAACHLPHLRLFVELAIGTGGRAGALLELTWAQVDLERRQIRLSKGGRRGKGRATVRIPERLERALAEARKASTSDYVIEWGGHRVRNIRKAFHRACLAAGLTDVTPHTLRHTAAVWMAEAGVPMSKIAQFLGHTKTTVTEKHYARYTPDFLKEAADALE